MVARPGRGVSQSRYHRVQQPAVLATKPSISVCRIDFVVGWKNVMQSRNTLCGRSPAHIIACALVVAAIGWTILPSWAQTRGNLDSHLKRAPFDENAWRASQRAREQHIRTWGFAPGQQAQPLPNSLPVTRWSSIGPLRISHGPDLFAAGPPNLIATSPAHTQITST